MPTITLTIPTAHLTRAVNALAVRHGYRATLDDGSPNPVSKQEFVRRRIAQWVRDEVREHEVNTARAAVVVPDVDLT